MRPIDADALIEKCGGWYVDECTESGFIGTLENLLATEPTIQPEKAQLSKEGTTSDTISRQAAIDALNHMCSEDENEITVSRANVNSMLKSLPSAQPERDIPKKPNETTDRTWGIPHRQAVCPNCDAYLGMIHFISENGKTKVTYCESCGQAIDWEGWKEDE